MADSLHPAAKGIVYAARLSFQSRASCRSFTADSPSAERLTARRRQACRPGALSNPPSGLTGLAPTADINSACRAMATRASHALNIVVGSCVARWRAHIVAPGSNRYGDLDRDGVSAGYARRCALPVLKAFATIQAGIVGAADVDSRMGSGAGEVPSCGLSRAGSLSVKCWTRKLANSVPAAAGPRFAQPHARGCL